MIYYQKTDVGTDGKIIIQLKFTTYCSLYPDRFVNDDNETIHRTVLYTNCSYFRTPRENGVVPVHINVSSTLVHNLINLVETPIFAFGKKSYRSVAQMLEMELVATTPMGKMAIVSIQKQFHE